MITAYFWVSEIVGFLWYSDQNSYRNDPKFSDRYACAVWSGSTLFAIQSASFGLITLG